MVSKTVGMPMTEISVKPIPMMPSNLPATKARAGSSVASAKVWSIAIELLTNTLSLGTKDE